MGSLMPEVKGLTLSANCNTEEPEEPEEPEMSYKRLSSTLKSFPRLQQLYLWLDGISLGKLLSHAMDHQLFSTLTELRLKEPRMELSDEVGCHHNLDVSRLQFLELHSCSYVVPFLNSLSRSYSEVASGKLKTFSIRLVSGIGEPTEMLSSIENLLKICPKLTNLTLDLGDCELIDKSCLLSHAETLRALVIGNHQKWKPLYFSAADLRSILVSCSRLKYLALNSPEVDLGKIDQLATSFHLNRSDAMLVELEDILVRVGLT
jgi:hypothetical protein